MNNSSYQQELPFHERPTTQAGLLSDIHSRSVRTESKIHTVMSMHEELAQVLHEHHTETQKQLTDLALRLDHLTQLFETFKQEWDAEAGDIDCK